MQKKVFPILITGLAAGVVSGCAFVERSYNAAGENSELVKADIQNNIKKMKPSSIEETDEIWLGGESFRVSERDRSPELFNRQVSFKQIDPITVSDLVTLLGSDLGIKVVLTEDAFEYVKNGSDDAESSGFEPAMGAGVNADQMRMASMMLSQGSKIPGSDIEFTLDYKGSLSGLLDVITGKLGLFWRYERGEIVIKRSETITYTVDIPSGKVSFEASMQSDIGGSEESGSSQHSTEFSFAPEDNWANMKQAIESMLSSTGKSSHSDVQGLVTVTDTPQVHTRVSEYIKTINSIASRQVAIEANVYEITSDHTGEFDANIQALYNWKGDLGLEVVDNLWTISRVPTGIENKFGGDSSAAINLLNTHKNSSLVTSSTIYAMNGHPTPFQKMNEVTYIAERSVTTVEGGTTESSVTPGKTTEGISMMLMPRITSDGRVMMNISIDTSTILALTKEGNESEEITMPSRATNRYQQVVTVGNGSPLMIAGLEQTNHEADIKSPLGRAGWFLGGSKSGGKTRTMTMIILTPYIMQK